MMHPWDAMISGDDAEVAAEIASDRDAYAKLLAAGDERGCVAIAEKYGLTALPPQQVSEQLAEMAKPAEDGEA